MPGTAGMTALVCKRLRVEGRVQGVGYRAWVAREAARLKLAGWVRNRYDGTVELVVQGPPGAVEALVWAARQGPAAAEVQAVRAETLEPGDFAGFLQLPTA